MAWWRGARKTHNIIIPSSRQRPVSDICVAAISQLEAKSNIKISNEERVKLVSNLLCVTVGEEKATPVLNV